jgi:hypothetical protein
MSARSDRIAGMVETMLKLHVDSLRLTANSIRPRVDAVPETRRSR